MYVDVDQSLNYKRQDPNSKIGKSHGNDLPRKRQHIFLCCLKQDWSTFFRIFQFSESTVLHDITIFAKTLADWRLELICVFLGVAYEVSFKKQLSDTHIKNYILQFSKRREQKIIKSKKQKTRLYSLSKTIMEWKMKLWNLSSFLDSQWNTHWNA